MHELPSSSRPPPDQADRRRGGEAYGLAHGTASWSSPSRTRASPGPSASWSGSSAPSSTAGGRRTTDERAHQADQGPQPQLEEVREVDPDGRIVVHHRLVDTLGRMLRSGTIDQAMHDAGRDFQAAFILAQLDPLRALPFLRVPAPGASRTSTSASSMRGDGFRRHCRRWAGTAVRPAPGPGTCLVASSRSASGPCARAGAAARSTCSKRRGSRWPRWTSSPGTSATAQILLLEGIDSLEHKM